MSAPRRIQRSRGRQWRLPEGAVYVGRPSLWGNPFRISRSSDFHGLPGSWFLMGPDGRTYHPEVDTQRSARSRAVELYTEWLVAAADAPAGIDRIRADLAGHDLVCWCPRVEPCHADVLLELANSPAPVSPSAARWPQRPGAPRTRSASEGGDQSELSS